MGLSSNWLRTVAFQAADPSSSLGSPKKSKRNLVESFILCCLIETKEKLVPYFDDD